jgi:hypothetical protein
VAHLLGGEMTMHKMRMTEKVIANPIIVEQPSQDECHPVTHRVSLAVSW